jgi:transposase InsO family protein
MNTDQGSQFTGEQWIGAVESSGARVSMDGKGRLMDNVFIERLWRSLKYEQLRLWSYATWAGSQPELTLRWISTTIDASISRWTTRLPGTTISPGRTKQAEKH